MSAPGLPRGEVLERLSLLCARRIEDFRDLTPMEVEAVCRCYFAAAASGTEGDTP